MSEQQVPTTRTQVTEEALFHAFVTAWIDMFGGENPKRESILVLLAQTCLETGGIRACWNWNLGNEKHVDGDGHDWCYLHHVKEILNGQTVYFDPPSPQCRFRAFAALEQGAKSHLRTLSQRFAKAWPAVVAGDPAAFGHALKAMRYYTASEAEYVPGLAHWYKHLDATMPST